MNQLRAVFLLSLGTGLSSCTVAQIKSTLNSPSGAAVAAGRRDAAAPPSAAAPAPSAEEPNSPRARSMEMADVYGLARASASSNVDCPVTLAQANELAHFSGGRLGNLVGQIGCLCLVQPSCGGWERIHCEASSTAPLRRSGEGLPPLNEDQEAVLSWGERLYASRKAPADKLTWLPALGSAREAHLGRLDPHPEAALERLKASIEANIVSKSWMSVDDEGKGAARQVASIEKQHCGEKNAKARALASEVEALWHAHRKEIAAADHLDDRMRADPLLKRLEAEEDRLKQQLQELEHVHGSAMRVCGPSERDSWKICRVSNRLVELGSQIDKRRDLIASGK